MPNSASNSVILPLELVDEIVGIAVQPHFGLKTHSALALTSLRCHMRVNVSRFATVRIGTGMGLNVGTLVDSNSASVPGQDLDLERRVALFAQLIRAEDDLGSGTAFPGVCGFVREFVLRIGDWRGNEEVERFFGDSELRFVLRRVLLEDKEEVGRSTTSTQDRCSFVLSLRYPLIRSSGVMRSIRDLMRSELSKVNHLFLCNVHGLQSGFLSGSGIRHLVLYRALAAAESDLDDNTFVKEEEAERQNVLCPLESLETDLCLTLAEHTALFQGVGRQRILDGVMFPCLTRLKLHYRYIHTREFNVVANEFLLNAPLLEELFVDNGDKLQVMIWPAHHVLPLRYTHLTRLRSITLGTRMPYKQIEILECLFAHNEPPRSLSEIGIEAQIEMRKGLSYGVNEAERYVRGLSLDRMHAFLSRPGFERVDKVVLRLGMALDVYELDDLDEDLPTVPWREALRRAVNRQLEMKALEVNVQLEL